MGNVTLNKPTTANNTFAPFAPSRAVDSVISAANRWVSSEVPAYLQVDLQGLYWINQYTANFMGSVNWPSNYNLSDFKVQSSMDGTNWTDIETFTGNTANQLNRTVTPRQAKFLRIYITKGLTCNNGVASIVDFQAFEPANAPFLSNLVPSTGTLNTAFSSRSLNYTLNVAGGTASVAFTPTAASGMVIKVGANVVASGQQSSPITLTASSTPVNITVTSSDNLMITTYTITVVKQSAACYLSNLTAFEDVIEANIPLAPSFLNTTLNYTATVGSDFTSVQVTPTTTDPTVNSIKVNTYTVASGTKSPSIPLNIGSNVITILLSSTNGAQNTYTITINKTA